MSVKVLDSSVLGAIVFGEPELAAAVALIGDAKLVAPTLLRYEIANVAWKKSKRHPAKADEVAAGLHFALEFDVEYVDVDVDEVLAVALDQNLTAYDACYAWLSRSLGAPIATFDKKLGAAR